MVEDHLARERLGLLPQQVDTSQPGGPQIRKIVQSAWTLAEQVNELRGLQGTGHGRTLPSGEVLHLGLTCVEPGSEFLEDMRGL